MHRIETFISLIIGVLWLHTIDPSLALSWGFTQQSDETNGQDSTGISEHHHEEQQQQQHRDLEFFVNGNRPSRTISGNPAVTATATVRRSWRDSRVRRRYARPPPARDEDTSNSNNLFPDPTSSNLPNIDRNRDPLERFDRKRVDRIRGSTGTPAPSSAPTLSNDNNNNNTIMDVLLATPEFGTLAGLIEMASLSDVLREPGPFTVFAPTDEAFLQVPDEIVGLIMSTALNSFLLYHVIPAQELFSFELQNGLLTTAEGSDVSVAINPVNGSITINIANVIESDILASNGVIHSIDNVLIPDLILTLAPTSAATPGVTAAPSPAVTTAAPTTAATTTAPTTAATTTAPTTAVAPDILNDLGVEENLMPLSSLRAGGYPKIGPRYSTDNNGRNKNYADFMTPQDIELPPSIPAEDAIIDTSTTTSENDLGGGGPPRIGPRYTGDNDEDIQLDASTICSGTSGPQDIAYGIQLQVARPPRYSLEECTTQQLQGLATVIETSLNMAFPFTVPSWPGSVTFSMFEFDTDQFMIHNNRQRRERQLLQTSTTTKEEELSSRHLSTTTQERELQQQQEDTTCPGSPAVCQDTAEACWFGCGIASVSDCSGNWELWENMGNVLSTSLSALSLPCLGHPNPPEITVSILPI